MKSPITTLIASMSLAVTGLTSAAAEPTAEDIAEPPLQEARQQVEAAATEAAATVDAALLHARGHAEAAQAHAESAQGKAARRLAQVLQRSTGGSGSGGGLTVGGGVNSVYGWPAAPGGSAPEIARPLIVGSSTATPEVIAALQEDLVVMARILDKGIASIAGQDALDFRTGIVISTFPSDRRVQSMYLEGYGALFFLNVKFPLVPPPVPETEAEEKPADDAWTRTKRELFGPREAEPGKLLWDASEKPVPYDANQVQDLKRDLLSALKNAANLRHVRPEENVTVAVVGGSGGPVSGTPSTAAVSISGYPPMELRHLTLPGLAAPQGGLGGESFLTIRVKKADIDALAKGDLSADEFEKKASVLTY